MRKHHSLLLASLFVGQAIGFRSFAAFPSKTTTNRPTFQPKIRLTQLQLSLEDSWEEALKYIPTDSVNLESISRRLADTRWTTLFSREWFSDVSLAAKEMQELYLLLPLWAEAGIIAAPVLAAIGATLYKLSFPHDDYRKNMEPYPRGDYDPVAARAYYARYPKLVAQRCLQLFRLANKFIFNILLDKYILKREEAMILVRANELLELITQLGPTAIKVGQALSVRPDLIPSEYASALSTLQDQVPPFDGQAAKEILLRELGSTAYAQLKGLGLDGGGGKSSKGPIASASIGQVYKASLDGKHVAVKVQRPNVLAEIALDLYIVREIGAPLYQMFTNTASDLQGLANEWGRGFIAELDYVREANNTIRFNQGLRERNLLAVCAPTVLTNYVTEQVLVTEWVDGVRLDQSAAEDIPRLCSVALNAYLVMLLELRSLHCDPHPGNLLRTTDGRLCILDHGMTLDIDPNLQYSLLEFVAHLTSNNYQQLPEDLVALDFLKADKLDFIRRSGALEPFKYVLKQAGQGGGAKGVRERIFQDYRAKYGIDATEDELRVEMRKEMKQQMADIVERESVATGITLEVEELQRRNQDAFRIPEWFLYTSQAFLTLEGVSLQADPNYSIIKSCFPYIAKRLVGDNDPRARKALRELLYGATNALDINRLTDLADGFSSYTTTTKTINEQAGTKLDEIKSTSGEIEMISKDRQRKTKMLEAEAAITLAKDTADILLKPNDNLIQSVLIEEGVLAASANVKDSIRRTMVTGPRNLRDSLPMNIGSMLPPLPFELQLDPFLVKTAQEVKAQALTERLMTVTSRQLPNADPESAENARKALLDSLKNLDAEQAALILKEIRENVPKFYPLFGLVGSKFAAKMLQTFSHNIDTTLDELAHSNAKPNRLLSAAAKQLSVVAQSGASTLS
ncbi:hypothetical protein MPSEU_000912800 [Mayamaea pseudoterrestris]|nr:hypothetical protein MPSEU_000912800 [Mayamaea pseudoterrestris]